jgi:long-chain acyl-CoA synthetase
MASVGCGAREMIATEPTMLELFRERARTDGSRIAIEELVIGGAPEDRQLSWADWHETSRQMAASLVEAGVQPGDRVAILAGNRMIWPVADLGILMAGAVSVGIYPTSAPAQVAQLLEDSGAVIAVADTAEQVAKMESVRASLAGLRIVVGEQVPRTVAGQGMRITLAEWMTAGASALRDPRIAAEVERRTEAATPDDVALLVYTSGSTGEPKGARITHRYLHASAQSLRETLGFRADDTTLSFLPYCHAGERVFGLYTRILCGMRVAHVERQSCLWDAARAFEPTVFGGLPRYFEKVYEALVLHEHSLSRADRLRWDEAIRLGRERTGYRRRGRPVPAALETAWQDLAQPCREKIATMLGARVRIATSGGATLPREVADYLDAAGLTVLGAYGQTEHLCVAFHRASHYDSESVGQPMPGTEARLDADGELLLRRGPLTFAGYHGRPEETRTAFTDDGAWLRTGDLAELTEDGRLRITGRKKEIIALSNGKKVAPMPIESALTQDAWIAHAMLYGEGRHFISALLVPSRPVVESWMRERGLTGTYETVLRHPDLIAHVQRIVDGVNARLSRPEQIRKWVLLEHELAPERNEITATMKVRRGTVTERYRARLESLYL